MSTDGSASESGRSAPALDAGNIEDRELTEVNAAIAVYKNNRRSAYIATGLALVIILVLAWVPVPYIKFSPGPMFSTIGSVDGVELISISDTETYPTTGELDMTTVSERGGPFGGLTLPEAFVGWIDPDQNVAPVDLFYAPDTTAEQAQEGNAADFTSSQSAAIGASLGYLDIPVTSEVSVVQVLADGPSAGSLAVNDIIRNVDGTKIDKPSELPPLIQAMKPGSTASFAITRDGKDQSVDVVLGESPRDPNQAYAGIAGGSEVQGPFPITFGLEDVGGPSAGLMFSLGIIDKLTPEELTAGRSIAGTGTITVDGQVGPIGGLPQKLYAARDEGTDLFLAPAGNCDDVLASAPEELNVAKVATLDEAISVLEKFRSGDPDLPRCS